MFFLALDFEVSFRLLLELSFVLESDFTMAGSNASISIKLNLKASSELSSYLSLSKTSDSMDEDLE